MEELREVQTVSQNGAVAALFTLVKMQEICASGRTQRLTPGRIRTTLFAPPEDLMRNRLILVSLFLCAVSAAYPQAATEGALVTGAAGSANARGAATLQHTINNATKQVNANIQSTTGAAQSTTPGRKPAAKAPAAAAPAKVAPVAETTTNPCVATPVRKVAANKGAKEFSIRGGHAKTSSPASTSTQDGVTIISEKFTVNGSLPHD